MSEPTPPLPASDAIAVIVVNWNAWRMSLDCLASLRASQGVPWHLFLVDNASSDDSHDHLVDLGDDVTVILADSNGGWTGGNNLGIRTALAAGYDRFFILNNDAQVKPDTMALLVQHADAQPVRPIIGPIHRDADGGRLNFIGTTPDPKVGLPHFINPWYVDLEDFPAAYDTCFIKGAAILAFREHFDRCGLFDDRYYLNCDEMDWCYRVREHGYGVRLLKAAEILHGGSASIGGAQSPLGVYFLTRNGFLFAELHCTRKQRMRHLIATVRWVVQLSGKPSPVRRLIATAIGSEKHAVAARRAAMDYLLRRFGDCPPVIRTLSGSR
ncbi:glycosyltransferase family 2 protein [uncultured Sphingomonas sp.]|uniref:glycosyltransferase family 2 protein n=1 Tax=uncultured Sphingomonas sp. TaxID=158754 RepID=UPI0035CC5C78